MTVLTKYDEMASDILTTAIEGGVNHWAGVCFATREGIEARVTFVRMLDPEDNRLDVTAAQISDSMLSRAAVAAHQVAETRIPPDRFGTLALRFALGDEDVLGDIDAGDADNIVQLALFGELVYG